MHHFQFWRQPRRGALIVSFVGVLVGLHQLAVPGISQGRAAEAVWPECRSDNAERRISACSTIIDSNKASKAQLAEALDARCWAYSKVARFDLAIADCNRSISLRPNYFYAYNNLGLALIGNKEFRAAVEALNKAVAIRPTFIWSFLNRAQAYVALGAEAAARRDYERALAIEPNNSEARQGIIALTSQISVTPQYQADSRPTDDASKPVSVKLLKEGGTFAIPVSINDVITLHFTLDSGAADVVIPADVISTLVRSRTIGSSDFIGQETYQLADGTLLPSMKVRLRSLRLGDVLLSDVIAAVSPNKGSLLLGQSFLGRFKSWTVDNHAMVLLINR